MCRCDGWRGPWGGGRQRVRINTGLLSSRGCVESDDSRFPSALCEAREGKPGRTGEGPRSHPSPQLGAQTSPPAPSAPLPPPPAAPTDEKARLGRRKLTVSGFDPRPRKETAPKKNITTGLWPRSGGAGSTRGLLIRGGFSGVGLHGTAFIFAA